MSDSSEDEIGMVEGDTEKQEQDNTKKVEAQINKVLSPTDSFAGHRITWDVSRGEGTLTIALVSTDFASFPGRNPMNVLVAAAQSLYVDCSHDRMTKLSTPARFVCDTTPAKPEPYPSQGSLVGIVQCDQNEKMRFFTLASGKPGVVRQDSCLQCCITYCRLASLKFVIC